MAMGDVTQKKLLAKVLDTVSTNNQIANVSEDVTTTITSITLKLQKTATTKRTILGYIYGSASANEFLEIVLDPLGVVGSKNEILTGLDYVLTGTEIMCFKTDAGSDVNIQVMGITEVINEIGSASNTLSINFTNQNATQATCTIGGTATTKTYSIDSLLYNIPYTAPFTVLTNQRVNAKGVTSGASDTTATSILTYTDTPVYSTPTITPSTTASNVTSVSVTITNYGTAPIKEYSFNNTDWSTYSTPLTINSNCTVYARGRDNVGNYSDVSSLVISNIEVATIEIPVITFTVLDASNYTIHTAYDVNSPIHEIKIGAGGTWLSDTISRSCAGGVTVYARSSIDGITYSAVAEATSPTTTTVDTPVITFTLKSDNLHYDVSIDYGNATTKEFDIDSVFGWYAWISAEVGPNQIVNARGSIDGGVTWEEANTTSPALP